MYERDGGQTQKALFAAQKKHRQKFNLDQDLADTIFVTASEEGINF